MRYVNTKTGAVIDSPCIISGGNWVPAEAEKQEEAEQVPAEAEKQASKKKGS